MHKNLRLILAVALTATCLSSSAQEQSDYFGKAPPLTERAEGATAAAHAPAALSEQRRMSISNRNGQGDESLQDDSSRDPGRERDLRRERDRYAPGQGPVTPTEFQKFVEESTGKRLPIFGAGFFANTPSTFAPLTNAPVPAEYTLGPGDELLIRGWGSIDIDFRARIDRNGMITIPTVGAVMLAGVKGGEAEAVVRNAVARLYKDVTVSVNFGRLRAITVYVVGQASRPGTYTVSSLSTLVTAVFASGGPNPNGSLRRVQVKRGGTVAAELDLYNFIAKGDKSADIKLQDGDTIFIPAATSHVALVGQVNSPGIYELRGEEESASSVLEFAGGMPVMADPRRAYLERIDVSRDQPRSVEQFALDKAGLKRTLKNGDVLNVISITPEFSNAVVLRGNVDQPLRAPYKDGMRVSDLIPSRDFLLTRRSLSMRNNALRAGPRRVEKADGQGAGSNQSNGGDGSGLNPEQEMALAAQIGNLIEPINWDYAVVERINRADLSVTIVPFNLGKVFSDQSGPDNLVLQPGDVITIFSQKDVAVPREKRRVYVRVEGEVNSPGVYQMLAGETLQSLLDRAGGTTSDAYLFGTAFYREQVRKEQEINLQKAADRLENQYRSAQTRASSNVRAMTAVDAQVAESERLAAIQSAKEQIARFRSLRPTGRISFALDPKDNSFAHLPQLRLEDGDRLVVPARPEFVHVFGAVSSEASPVWKPRARVKDYLRIVGLTADADLDNIVVMRIDGSVVSRDSGSWLLGSIGGVEVMPGDSIVVPEKTDKETAWSKFTKGTREWAQIFANFGLGAAAVKTLRD